MLGHEEAEMQDVLAKQMMIKVQSKDNVVIIMNN